MCRVRHQFCGLMDSPTFQLIFHWYTFERNLRDLQWMAKRREKYPIAVANRVSAGKEQWKYSISRGAPCSFAFLVGESIELISDTSSRQQFFATKSKSSRSRLVASLFDGLESRVRRSRNSDFRRVATNKVGERFRLIDYAREWQIVNWKHFDRKPFAKLDLLLRTLQILFHQHQLSGDLGRRWPC